MSKVLTYFNFKSILKHFDPWLSIPVVLLVATSCVMLFSIDQATGEGSRALKQLIFFAVGVGIFFALHAVTREALQAYGPWMYVASVVLLVLVLVFGTEINGTTGWFVFGSLSFQPVELVKVLTVGSLAWFFSRYGGQTQTWRPIVVSFAALSVLLALVRLQPDLGSAATLFFLWVTVVFIVHRKRWHLVVVAASCVAVATVGWFLLNPIQKDRVLNFIQPERDTLGSGYNVQQAMIAVGSGGVLGRGLGLGSQSQLQFLPEQETDFIFSVVAEELGLLGAGAVLLLYAMLLWHLFHLSATSPSTYASLLMYGLCMYFFGQLTINVGMNLGVFPVVGLPLPFVSAGGSSLLASFVALGLIQAVRRDLTRE